MAAVTLLRGSARAVIAKPTTVAGCRTLKYELKPKPTKKPMAVPFIPQENSVDDKYYPDAALRVGMDKLELDAEMLGIDDPYNLEPVRRHWGTKEDPVLVPARYSHRMVCCYCGDGDTVHYQMFYTGAAQRCACGQVFKLFKVKRIHKIDTPSLEGAHH
eukprot:scpid100703/ scgid35613/ Cytochrome c oxidase subunit 5B, mitochondrial; Cytochrome c oxidase polypeptide Vb; Cytochrome c oxidase subunit VIA*